MNALVGRINVAGLVLGIAVMVCLVAVDNNGLHTNLEMATMLRSMFAKNATHTDPLALLVSEPRDWRGYYVRGKLALRAGDAGLAIRWLKPAVEMQPDAPLPRFALGEAYLETSDDAAAVQELQRVQWAGRYFRILGEGKASERYLRLAIAIDPESSEAYYALADVLWNAWHRDEAVAIYKEGLSHDSSNSAQTYLAQARIRESEKEWEAAIQSYLRAIDLEPRNADAYHRLGELYTKQGDVNQAIYWFERSVDVASGYLWSYLSLGNGYKRRGDYEQALAQYERAVEKFPESGIPLRSIGWLKLEQGEPEEARAYFEIAIDKQPMFSWNYYDFAKFLMQIDRPGEAIEQLEMAVSLAPEIAAMHLALGDAYRATGECQAALDEYERVLVLEPENMEAARALEGLLCR